MQSTPTPIRAHSSTNATLLLGEDVHLVADSVGARGEVVIHIAGDGRTLAYIILQDARAARRLALAAAEALALFEGES